MCGLSVSIECQLHKIDSGKSRHIHSWQFSFISLWKLVLWCVAAIGFLLLYWLIAEFGIPLLIRSNCSMRLTVFPLSRKYPQAYFRHQLIGVTLSLICSMHPFKPHILFKVLKPFLWFKEQVSFKSKNKIHVVQCEMKTYQLRPFSLSVNVRWTVPLDIQ
jgi:hypothetical protein